MTDLVSYDHATRPRWAEEFAGTAEVAADLARTPFVPASLRVYVRGDQLDAGATAANVAAAILTGAEIGLAPMAALRAIYVVNGTPAISALGLRALVQSHGHGIWVTEATDTRAVVEGLRHGDGQERTQRVQWTMDDAKRRNLANKGNWRAQPRQMLVARATADLCRLIAADVVLAMPYVVEELDDPDELPDAAKTPSADANGKTAKRTARRATVPALGPVDPPPAAVADPPGNVVTPEPPPPGGGQIVKMSNDQRKALMASFRDLGITERPERLRDCTQIVGRTITSLAEGGDITFGEAHQILAALELRRAQRASAGASDERRDDGPDESEPGEDEPSTEDMPLWDDES